MTPDACGGHLSNDKKPTTVAADNDLHGKSPSRTYDTDLNVPTAVLNAAKAYGGMPGTQTRKGR